MITVYQNLIVIHKKNYVYEVIIIRTNLRQTALELKKTPLIKYSVGNLHIFLLVGIETESSCILIA